MADVFDGLAKNPRLDDCPAALKKFWRNGSRHE
jgi:hypothetical protein